MNNLLNLQKELSEQMTAALNDGDADALVRLDGMLKELEPKILAAELSDLKAKIARNKTRQGEIKIEIEALYRERAKRQRVVAEAADLYNRAANEVAKVDFTVGMLNIELESTAVSNREMRERIDSLKDAKMKEVMNNGNRFSQ